ncbi:PEP-CTERM sorting domain-containing protein, partial [Paraglaciecola sp.]|uniref:PEP-CTERM sorting domain-containing protein n=1 Tax=Paraglaciecola sp. TaxID=1920173 RepID=UPI0030F43CFA
MKYVKTAVVGLILMFSSLANASLINYDLVLTADSDFTSFGGGFAGDQFFGTFSIDESLVNGVTVYDPNLTGSLLFMSIDIGGTIFSDVSTKIYSNGLRFMGGPLLDISFLLVNDNNDQLSVLTDFGGSSSWWAIEGATGDNSLGGNTFGFSVVFNKSGASTDVPAPATLALFTLGLLGLAARRFKNQ